MKNLCKLFYLIYIDQLPEEQKKNDDDGDNDNNHNNNNHNNNNHNNNNQNPPGPPGNLRYVINPFQLQSNTPNFRCQQDVNWYMDHAVLARHSTGSGQELEFFPDQFGRDIPRFLGGGQFVHPHDPLPVSVSRRDHRVEALKNYSC